MFLLNFNKFSKYFNPFHCTAVISDYINYLREYDVDMADQPTQSSVVYLRQHFYCCSWRKKVFLVIHQKWTSCCEFISKAFQFNFQKRRRIMIFDSIWNAVWWRFVWINSQGCFESFNVTLFHRAFKLDWRIEILLRSSDFCDLFLIQFLGVFCRYILFFI